MKNPQINNKLWVSFSLLIILIFSISMYFMFRDSPILESIERGLLDNKANAVVHICDKPLKNLDQFIRDFGYRHQVKTSGSNPKRFFELKIDVSSSSTRFYVGEDSRNKNLFWIYSYEKPMLMLPLAYISTSSFTENIESRCSETKNAWVNEYIPQ